MPFLLNKTKIYFMICQWGKNNSLKTNLKLALNSNLELEKMFYFLEKIRFQVSLTLDTISF